MELVKANKRAKIGLMCFGVGVSPAQCDRSTEGKQLYRLMIRQLIVLIPVKLLTRLPIPTLKIL
jgi:hypothetical protein